MEPRVVNIPIDRLKPLFARKVEEESLEGLAQSIKFTGVLEPLIVRGSDYGIIAGYRRYLAAMEAGLTEVPCVLVECDDAEAFRLSLIENIQRENLSDYEVAKRLAEFKAKTGLTDEQIAQLIGKSRSWVTNHLRMIELEKLSNVSRETFHKITEGHARAILSQKTDVIPTLMREVEEAIRERGEPPSIREIEQVAKTIPIIKQAHPKLQEAVEKHIIPISVAAKIAEFPHIDQERIIEKIQREKIEEKDIKSLLNVAEKHGVEKVLKMSIEEIKALEKGKTIIETKEQLQKVLEKKRWQEEWTCPKCGQKFRVKWNEGTVEWI